MHALFAGKLDATRVFGFYLRQIEAVAATRQRQIGGSKPRLDGQQPLRFGATRKVLFDKQPVAATLHV